MLKMMKFDEKYAIFYAKAFFYFQALLIPGQRRFGPGNASGVQRILIIPGIWYIAGLRKFSSVVFFLLTFRIRLVILIIKINAV